MDSHVLKKNMKMFWSKGFLFILLPLPTKPILCAILAAFAICIFSTGYTIMRWDNDKALEKCK